MGAVPQGIAFNETPNTAKFNGGVSLAGLSWWDERETAQTLI